MSAWRSISPWLAAACFVVAVLVGVLSVLLSIGVVREYGPAEGYGNLFLQVLPIGGVGLILAGALGWLGVRLLRGGKAAGSRARA